VGNYNEVFNGIDTAKLRNAVAVAEAGREEAARYLTDVDTGEAAARKCTIRDVRHSLVGLPSDFTIDEDTENHA
jgi:hypothetical protein